MSEPDVSDPDRTLVAERLAKIGSLGETIERAPFATLRPESPDASLVDSLAVTLRELGVAEEPDREPAIRLGKTIGEGGMGVVREGVQVVLGRKVAVKTLRAELASERGARKLVHEARVTGALEHPNVVPVHDIARDPTGAPLIVLKHIDGVAWSALLRDPERLRREHGARDPLEWHLRVLLQVCNAIEFAHSRGVLHRDLKPDNVMIGGFGEVYVLDWGLAMRLVRDGEDTLTSDPGVERQIVLAGTPWYAAPEMLGGPGARLSAATDVYLLGGLLHEIVTGRAPHQEATLAEILGSILRSRPELPADVPEELAAIVRRALDPDPARRFPTAEALRAEIERFLAHRGAVALAIDAERSLAALLEELERSGGPRREHIDRLFAECRFGFRAALRAWPENARARRGLERAVERMVEHELGAERPDAAAALLGELETVPDDLRERVAAAVKAREARQRALERLGRELDPERGRRARLAISIFVGVFWMAGQFVAQALDPGFGATHASLAILPGTVAAIVAVVALALRRHVLQTRFNRSIAAAFFLSQLSELAIYAGGAHAGFTVDQCRALVPLMAACLVAMLAAAVSAGFGFAALAYFVNAAIGIGWPEARPLADVLANAVLTVTAIVIWGGRSARAREAG